MAQIKQLFEVINNDIENTSRYYTSIPCAEDTLRPSTKRLPDEKRTPVNPEQRIELLHRNFRAIPPSPKNAGLYRVAYVYPEKIDPMMKASTTVFVSPSVLSQRPKIINDPSLNPEELARSLANRAKAVRSSFCCAECSVIVGERGVGKSAFLNYLFSTQHSVFGKQSVIWVLVDLSVAESLNLSLMDSSDIQTYDVLCKHYIGGGEFPQEADFFDDTDYMCAKEEYVVRSELFSIDKFKEFCLTIPVENIMDKQVSDSLLTFTLRQIKDTAISYEEKLKRLSIYRQFVSSKGYSFIYIMDGLDEATVPMQEQETLKRWRANVYDIMQGRNVPEGLYLLCARSESFRDISSHLESQTKNRQDMLQWVVSPAPISTLLEKRIALFEERIKKTNKRVNIEYWEPGSAKLITDLTLHLIRCAFNDLEMEGNPIEIFSSSGHMRSLMKFLRDALWETTAIIDEEYGAENPWLPKLATYLNANPSNKQKLEELMARKSYRIWAIASLNYGNYFEQSIRYDSQKQKLIYPTPSGEFPLIPVVWGDIALGSSHRYFNNHLLTKIRVLQLLEQNREKSITFQQVKDIISDMYQHNPGNVEILMKAMMLERLVDTPPDEDCLQGFRTSRIRITDIGSILVKKWLVRPEYMESTINFAAVPNMIASEFPRFFIERKGGPLANVNDPNYLAPPRYTVRIFRTLAKFIALVSAIERWEKTRVALYYSEPRETTLEFKPEYVCSTMIERLIEKVQSLLQSAAGNEKLKRIVSRLVQSYGVSSYK